ncbi:Hypothetical predicted protein [Xyrichtys novacula]|uniref:Uncharacterized protein n=1 Tax=Xyrichtys novacula TaxID=13765 RepID=A0AAV1HAK0_XYRNO|nr:Hypothetical predicted protein [Xyrichtys novacula]
MAAADAGRGESAAGRRESAPAPAPDSNIHEHRRTKKLFFGFFEHQSGERK